MSSRTAWDAIKKFVAEIYQSDILGKFDQIQGLISGPINIAKTKIKAIDSVGDISDFIPGIPVEYKGDLRRVIFDSYEEEVQQAVSILDEIEIAVAKLQTVSETFNQRVFEAFRSQNRLVIDNRELTACHEDCRRILTYFKLKISILRHYFSIPFINQPATVPLENLRPYEETALELILRLKIIKLPLSHEAETK